MSIWNDCWELFFPRCCVVCGKRLLKAERDLCIQCLAKLPRTNLHQQKNNEMEQAFWGRFPIERASAFLYYSKGGDVRKLLYALKYYGHRQVGEVLGRYMACEMVDADFFNGIDCIIPVPLHPQKLRIRGYNQSELLARGVSSVTGIPVLTDRLCREQHTETQTHKSRYGRWKNVNEMFSLNTHYSLKDKHVLLVDDVFTTGATLIACADAMKSVSGIRISVLTLALAGET